MAKASLWLKKAEGSFHGLRQASPSGNVTYHYYGNHRKIIHIFFDFGGLTTAQRFHFGLLRTIKPPTKRIGGNPHARTG